jgi:predicted nucleic acid-binding protein
VLLLDTSVLVNLEHELSEGRVGEVRTFLGARRSEAFACTTVTVGELAAGAPETSVRFMLRRLRRIPLTEAIAYRAGQLDRELASAGKRLGENDNWIAATALHLSATLVYADGDFERVPRLKRQRIRSSTRRFTRPATSR